MTKSPAGWLPRDLDQLWALRLLIKYGTAFYLIAQHKEIDLFKNLTQLINQEKTAIISWQQDRIISWDKEKSQLTLSPLSSHSMESPNPELPDTTLFVTVFLNFQVDISALRE